MRLIIRLKNSKVIESDVPNSIIINGDLVKMINKIKSEDLPIENNGKTLATGGQIYSIEIVF